jgi:hypothetical protein
MSENALATVIAVVYIVALFTLIALHGRRRR